MKTFEELLDFYDVKVGKEYRITFSTDEKLVGRKFIISKEYKDEFFNFHVIVYKDDINEDDIIHTSLSFLNDIDYKEIKTNAINSKERKYLGSVIKPFRDRVMFIKKQSVGDDPNKEYIYINIDYRTSMYFPPFDKDTMYKGMDSYKSYTLEELGL